MLERRHRDASRLSPYGKELAEEEVAMEGGITGRSAIETLARRFPQLYVAPSEGSQNAHRLASGRGIVAPGADLGHFIGSSEDELRELQTPAGEVEVLFLKERVDFETFMQTIGHKSQPVQIPRTIGAITYRGLADWGKVASAREAYRASGGDDWEGEFARLAKQPGAFRSEIVVISEGPYSGVPACETPYAPDEWLRVSREIRLRHECAHVVCRRLMPDDILPVWDEMTADVVGMLFATARYDAPLAARFLGVGQNGFLGGRLPEYLDDELTTRIDEVAVEVFRAIGNIEGMCGESEAADPFGFLLRLKAEPLVQY